MAKVDERQQLITAYDRSPGLLARDLSFVFGTCENSGQMAIHNKVIKDIMTMCAAHRAELLRDVAQTILNVARLK